MIADGLVLPLGHYVGRFHPEAFAPASYHKVRLGREVLRLTDDTFAVWALSHGLRDRIGAGGWTRHTLLDAARGMPDPEKLLDWLIGDGLVAEVVPGSREAIHFAGRYRIQPLMTGLGNTAAEPLRFSIGILGQPPAVTVDAIGYELWQWGRLDRDLWQVAQRLVAVQDRVSPGRQPRPEEMLTGILERLPLLLAHNAAYLDPAEPPQD
jgi:hypothetical protein